MSLPTKCYFQENVIYNIILLATKYYSKQKFILKMLFTTKCF